MKRKTIQKAAAIALSAALIAAPIASFAGESDSLTQSGSTSFISQIGQWVREKLQQLGQMPSQGSDFFSGMEGESEAGTPQTQGKTPGQMGGMHGQMGGAQLAAAPTEIQTSTLPDAAIEEIRGVVQKYGGEVKSVGNTRTTLEDLFLRIVEESKQHPGRRAHGGESNGN